MENSIVEFKPTNSDLDSPLTVDDVKAQIELIQQVMKAVMQEGSHFGVIPGCGDKPSLFKASSLSICRSSEGPAPVINIRLTGRNVWDELSAVLRLASVFINHFLPNWDWTV